MLGIVSPLLSVTAGSENVTVANDSPGSASVVMSPRAETTGGSLILTVTVNCPESELPEASTDAAVTVVTPIGNAVPEGGTKSVVQNPELSVQEFGSEGNCGTKFTIAVGKPGSVFTTGLLPSTPSKIGSSLSTIVIVNEAVAMFPTLSVAVHVTVVTQLVMQYRVVEHMKQDLGIPAISSSWNCVKYSFSCLTWISVCTKVWWI